MTSIMVTKLNCSNAPINYLGHLDGKVHNRAFITIVGTATKISTDELSNWVRGMKDIEGVIVASSNGTAKGATALGVSSSALSWSTKALTNNNYPTTGSTEILLVGRMD